MSSEKWLIKTHQVWKVWVIIIFSVMTLTNFFVFMMLINNHTAQVSIASYTLSEDLFIGLFFLFGWSFVLMLFWGIRCPHCRCFVGYEIAKGKIRDFSFADLLGVEVCPKCLH